MHLGQGTNERMVDLEVYDPSGENKGKSNVEKVSPCDNDPGLMKPLALLL
jgi:hypothetical protein